MVTMSVKVLTELYVLTAVESLGGKILGFMQLKVFLAFLIVWRPSSVRRSVRLSVCLSVNFSYFQLLLQNHWATFNQT